MSSPYEPFGSNNPFGPPTPFQPSSSQSSSFQPSPFPGQGGDPYPPSGPTATSPLAIASLIGGVLSIAVAALTCCCPFVPVAIVTSLASIVAGHLAIGQINRSEGRTGGKELAIFGLLAAYPALIISGAITAFFIYALVTADPKDNAPRVYQPGEEELSLVEQRIMSKSNGIAQGNSPEAIALAKNFSDKMKTLREAFFTEEQKKGISLSDGEFITWCQWQDGKCAFIVHVPSYRKFDEDAKDTLEEMAWMAAQQAVRGTVAEGNELAVGMKGVLLWGDVKVGRVVAEGSEDDGIDEHGDDEELLYPFFIPPPPKDPDAPAIKLPEEPAEEASK